MNMKKSFNFSVITHLIKDIFLSICIMFDDMFDTAEEILTGVKEGAVQSSWDRLPRNCADLLPLPQKQRKKGYPIGLKNQGATCYLNSFLQILYHTPELRKTILQLPLCNQNIQTKSDFVKGAKHTFLFGFQRLFSQMSLRDTYAVETDYLNKAFGWQGKEHVEQQDMTEAMKIIFDTMERALFATPYESVMKNLFKGSTARYKACQTCTVRSERDEDFYDFVVQVNGVKSLDQALMASLTPQIMDGENKIFCDVCQAKQDMYLGTRFKNFPNILVFTLNRFSFDFETMDRVKLNSYFEFDLEEKLSHLVDDGQDHEFELYGVIIHRGSAHGGHYFAYIRDVMHESNWVQSIEEAHNEEQKRQKEKQTVQLTEQQKKKKEQLQKQDKKHPLKEPENKKLLQNWYELNDSIATAIDAQKITSKFEGSESAYILFYRRKGVSAEQLDIQVPEYFKSKIEEHNKKVREEREKYEFEKQHIVLKVNGTEEKLNVKTPIKTLLQKFCPDDCFALVMESVNNGIPYYPMEFNSLQKQFGPEDTIQKHQVFHESCWKTYLVTDEQYLSIKPNIGKEKLPFQVNILLDGDKKKTILYQDQTLSDFRKKIEQDFDVPYENQIIQLVTPYKEVFLTDNLEKDAVLLTKLGFIHEAQVILKNLPPDAQNYDQEKDAKTQKVDKDLYCFVVQRDDQIGIKKFYFSKYETLQALLQFISKDIVQKDSRRLRNLNGNRLYYIDHYPKQLIQLDFLGEEMVKLRVERGQIPIKGDVCVKAKLQSKFQQVPENTIIEKVFDPNTTISQLKNDICAQAKLDPEQHRVYLTDWMGEPVRSITKETQSIFEANFSRQETICLRDVQSPIGSELLHFEVFVTETGSPDNISNDSFHSKSEIHKTVLQFKEKLLEQAYFRGKNLKPKQIRIRELKRDYMFGNVWRNHDKLMKDVQVNTNKLVVQILREQQELKDDQIVLTLKKRNIEKRIYEGNVELIFEAGKEPKVEDLTKAVKEKLQLAQDFPLMLIKYFNYNFEWIELSKEKLEKSANQKKETSDKGGKKDKGKNKGDNKNQGQKKNQPKKDAKKQVQSSTIQTEEKSVEQTQKQVANKQAPKTQVVAKQQPVKQAQQQQKKKKQKKAPQAPAQKTDFLNLRKPPTLLKDGDWIGWGNAEDIKQFKDDLQTEEDLSLRFIKKSNKNAVVYRRNEGGGFKINVDF